MITTQKTILIIFGTRPEALKLISVINSLKSISRFKIKLCVTAQHREMLDQVLNQFQIIPDYDFNLMQVDQDLSTLTSCIIKHCTQVLLELKPDLVLVHGDTTTALAASLAAFYQNTPIAHIEAGLRTGNHSSPWPEELNRKLIACLAQYHFAPTEQAQKNLLQENIPHDQIIITGNTIIDILYKTQSSLESDQKLQQELQNKYNFLNHKKYLILVTAHRRENFGKGLQNICEVLQKLAQRPDLQIIYPVHLNPNVQKIVQPRLNQTPNIYLTTPLNYFDFIYLLQKSDLILTDSGGLQEEAAFFQKQIFIIKNTTERTELLLNKTSRIVGSDNATNIIDQVNNFLDSPHKPNQSQYNNLYGNGNAAEYITKFIDQKIWMVN